MAGVYVHIPYCRSKCSYCAFNSRPLPLPGALDDYLAALAAELRLRRAELRRLALDTVYFGGGTPSLVPPDALADLLGQIRLGARPGSVPGEVTLEANPEGVDEAWLARLRAVGFTRLSVGVQSFDPAALRFLGRRHGPADGPRVIEAARRAGFANVGLDLILGLPPPLAGLYERDVPAALACAPDHVSAYLLTVEEPAPYALAVARGEAAAPAESEQVAAFRFCHDALAAAGFRHYEISNFARPGARSRHNSAYWTGAPYLGLGAGAHSLVEDDAGGLWRRANVDDPSEYVRRLSDGEDPALPAEALSPETAVRERLMLAVRTAEGVALADFDEHAEPLARALDPMVERGWFDRSEGGRYRPTVDGFLRADAVALALWEALD